jgi:hypothetical protein
MDGEQFEVDRPSGRLRAVRFWSQRYLPFEHLTPAQLTARGELRSMLTSLDAAGGEILHATYAGPKPVNMDVENLLLYNIDPGGRCFSASTLYGVRFELAGSAGRRPPSGRDFPCYYQYELAPPGEELRSWRPVRVLATFTGAALGKFPTSKRLEQTWLAVRHADSQVAPVRDSPLTAFATMLKLTPPQGIRVALRPELVKALMDGVIAAFQAHRDPTTLSQISERIARTTNQEPSRVAELLLDDRNAVLGAPNHLVHLRGAGVQWNPSDHLCVAGQVHLAEPVGPQWRLSGELWALEPLRPPSDPD